VDAANAAKPGGGSSGWGIGCIPGGGARDRVGTLEDCRSFSPPDPASAPLLTAEAEGSLLLPVLSLSSLSTPLVICAAPATTTERLPCGVGPVFFAVAVADKGLGGLGTEATSFLVLDSALAVRGAHGAKLCLSLLEVAPGCEAPRVMPLEAVRAGRRESEDVCTPNAQHKQRCTHVHYTMHGARCK